MPQDANIALTPHYLLLGDTGPIGPNVVRADSEENCSTVYGFSSKTYYDRFCAAVNETLRPYPLLPGHLANEAKPDIPSIALVVVDAGSSNEAELRAVSAETLLNAFQNRLEAVPTEIHLIQNAAATEYQLDTARR